jgi:hypothetical protein
MMRAPPHTVPEFGCPPEPSTSLSVSPRTYPNGRTKVRGRKRVYTDEFDAETEPRTYVCADWHLAEMPAAQSSIMEAVPRCRLAGRSACSLVRLGNAEATHAA